MKRANRARTRTVIAFWLTPARTRRDLFAELIRILAKELKVPRFEPHLTICSGPDTKELRDAVRKVTGTPVRLNVTEVAATNDYTKSLFIRFAGNPALEEINRKLRGVAELPGGNIRDPHVSLLYSTIPLAAKKDLAATIRLPFREVVFDSIKAVRCNAETKTPADVYSWRVIATKKLSA